MHAEKLSSGRLLAGDDNNSFFYACKGSASILEKVRFALALTRGSDRGAIAIDGMASLAHPSSVSISIFNHRESSNRRVEGVGCACARRMLLCVVVGHY